MPRAMSSWRENKTLWGTRTPGESVMKRAGFAGALIAALALVSAGSVQADDFPSHPLTMMVGFPPGGPTDTLARIVADGMKNALGQPIAVATVSGASGTIA